ncbi:FUSC family protein [Actinomycetospora chlora]|uniref:FUSC family protein n=1 Tax=Actinomycetospora chlora TaxID=663608 RepID=A0ABP9CDX9_9PSEU
MRWLVRRDPGLGATHRALRVAVVATAAFMLCRYALGSTTAATYAAFGAIGFGVLSQVVGTGRQRTRTLVACFLSGSVLITAGTLLAGSTAAATVGMLVVGVVVAFLPIGGPRPAGVANGLQLLYILPSFPPFAPETLGMRVLGLAVGMGFLALADRVLWPPRPVASYACRAAGAARALADLLDALTTATRAGATSGDGLAGARTAAAHAGGRLKLQVTPWEVRPTGPARGDRGRAHLGPAMRSVQGRVEALLATCTPADGILADAVEAGIAAAGGLRRTADALRHGAARDALPAAVAELDAARVAYTDKRLVAVTTLEGADAVAHARWAVAVTQVLSSARVAVQAAVIVTDPHRRTPQDIGWWAGAPTGLLWWRRIRAHLSPRSVYLQNAVRLGVGLALARLVAGELDLSHGLWVLLATLTLMRTSVTSTRATLLPAIVGTTAGAVVAAGLLEVVGQHTLVYALLFPVLCVAAVLAGQLIGMIAAQACFTVLVAALFAQLAPAGPSLAGVRLLDVLVGAVVGIAVGAAVWPAGGHGELRRAAARSLRALADLVRATAAWIAGTGSRDDLAAHLWTSDHVLLFFEADFLQYRAERRRRHEDDVDWFTVLAVVHRTMRTTRAALDEPAARELGAIPWPALTAQLDRDARDLAEGYAAVARCLSEGRTPHVVLGVPADFVDRALRAIAEVPGRHEHPRAVLRLVDAWGRLGWAAEDLAALGVVLAPVAVPRGRAWAGHPAARRRQPA